MPGATNKHATTTPTPTTSPIPTPTVAQAHRESREQQGTTLAQTTGWQFSYAALPPPRMHSQHGTSRQSRVHWQSEPGQRAPDETGAATRNVLAGRRSCTQTLTPPRHWPSTSPMLAAQGRTSATLKGVVSSVRMCETLGIAARWLPHSTGPYPRQQTGPTHTHRPGVSGPMRTHCTYWTNLPRGHLAQQSSRWPVWGQPCAGVSVRPLQCGQQTWRHPGEWPSMTRRPNAGGSRHGSATGARRGECACTPLFSTGRVGSRYSPQPLNFSTP